MKIAVFGATGGTGKSFVEQAIAAGHSIRALVKDKVRITRNDIEVIEGDVLRAEHVSQTLEETEAVVCILGSRKYNPVNGISEGTRMIVEQMKNSDIDRLMVVTSLGVGDSWEQTPLAFRMVSKTVLRKVMKDKERQEQIVQASGLNWTIVRPGGLQDGPATGAYIAGVNKSLKGGRISRADVAAYLLDQLESDAFIHQAPVILGA
jgi:putative NADH-flavin reductase